MSAAQGLRPVVVAIDAIESHAIRLPPFGREVAEAVKAGARMNVYLYATRDAWDRARNRRGDHGSGSALLLPPGDDPARYRWPTVPNGVFIVATGQTRRLAFALAQAVVSHGTQMTFAVFGDGEALIVKSAEWRVAA